MSASKQTGKGGETTRFKKGQSGNPKGRPRSGPKFAPSAYSIIIDRTLTITQDGVPREATLEEALQLKNYQLALDGNASAVKEVLKMIGTREQFLVEKRSKKPKIEPTKYEYESDNNFDALLLLDLAVPDMRYDDGNRYRRLLLQPWAVQMALNRRGLKKPKADKMADIMRSTLDAETLVLPKRFKE